MKQKGMTLIGSLLTVIGLCFAGLLVLKITPIYIQNYEVVASIKALSNLSAADFSGDMQSDLHVMRSKLRNQFYVNSIDDVDPDTVIFKVNDKGGYDASLAYEAKRQLFYNIYLMVKFDIHEEVKVSVE